MGRQRRRLLRLLPRPRRLRRQPRQLRPRPLRRPGRPIPDEVSDLTALFASDAAPTGWTGADQAEVKPGDVVAVWGAGGVGQMAARASMLLGAERVVVIDRFENRLAQVSQVIGPRP